MLTREASAIATTASGAAAEAIRRSQRRSRRQYQTRATKTAATDATMNGARYRATASAQPVLLKNSTRSRPQRRNADNPSNWITSEWATNLALRLFTTLGTK